ncbi:allatostatin-A receptor-like [Lingula anatina]|uniref:Allatostatin-A receptor-like n=1 Tax=Lingula anatina TaxID=7574 RepID=A0A1S3KDL3_LINAN|nr:allatostatin-A receptor-like [Lingula anatina]XP_013420582.1 allatostatin-A receptor-like [Lingula anatina]|eukprot:XP_013420581.1 allatostatin-A receptor-like [Lingula anatina]
MNIVLDVNQSYRPNVSLNGSNSKYSLNLEVQREIALYFSLAELFSVLCPIIFGCFLLVGVIGNGMVIYVILANKYLRTCPNMLFLNLAIADMLFLVFCVPLQSAFYIKRFDLTLGEPLCKLFKYTIFVTMSVSAYSLMIICVFRCIAVAFPLHASRILTKRYALVASAAIWLSMAIVNSPLALYYTESNNSTGACTITYHHKDTITSITVGVDFLLPIVICFVGTTFIITALRRNRGVIREMENETMERIETSRRSTRKLVILVVSVAVVFFVFWAPFLIISVLNALPIVGTMDTITIFVASVTAQILAFSNSCVNPIIYNFVSTDFRRAFRRAIQCRFSRMRQSHQSSAETTRSDILLRERTLIKKSFA